VRGIRFALYPANKKIGFPGWPEPILDSVTGFGASIAKRGLAPAPFFISKPHFYGSSDGVDANESFSRDRRFVLQVKKVSGRWGDRPLGRGMEGTVIRSQFGLSGRSAALASSRTTHRSRQVTTVAILQKDRTTSDYFASLQPASEWVDSSVDSFFAVLPAPTDDSVFGTEVPSGERRAHNLGAKKLL
jgi:hypothetical protein